MVTRNVADLFIPETGIRNWGKSVELFPSYDLKEDVSNLGLARRVKQWFHTEIKRIVDLEVDTMYYKKRRALQSISDQAEQGLLSQDEAEELEFMINTMFMAKRTLVAQQIEFVLNTMLPNCDPLSAGFMVLWCNQRGRDKGREGRITLRSGKGIRRMFPCLDDKEIEELNDKYRHEFSVRELTLKWGQTRENFAHAYHHEMGKLENPTTCYQRKNLGNSCMRYNFKDRPHAQNLPMQPTEAYASGDFTIYWTEDEKGLVCSRCVVRDAGVAGNTPPMAAPIYGVCEKSLDIIEEKLKSIGAELYNTRTMVWTGARLLRFDLDENEYVAPYLDVQPQYVAEDENDDKYLIIDRAGAINASSYQGILYGANTRCYNCRECVDHNELHNLRGDDYCQDCYYNLVSNCEYCGDDAENDDTQTVHTMNGTECWCNHCAHNHTEVTDSGETWHDEYVLLTHNGKTISQEEYDDEYFTSDWDGDIYHTNMMVDYEDGSVISVLEVRGTGFYYYCKDSETWKENDDDDDNQTPSKTES